MVTAPLSKTSLKPPVHNGRLLASTAVAVFLRSLLPLDKPVEFAFEVAGLGCYVVGFLRLIVAASPLRCRSVAVL